MARNINDHDGDVIINCGAFNYQAPKIANILDWPVSEVENLLNDINSDLSKLYVKGKDRADYVIDLKLFELAQSGDLKALEEFENRKSQQDVE